MSPDVQPSDDRPCILVAEDEMMIAMLLEDLLERSGYRVLMVARLARGLELAVSEPIDAAILDINLAGQDSFPIADALRHRDIPFLFASGYGSDNLPETYRGVTVLQKPYDVSQIKAGLALLFAAAGPPTS